MQKKGGVELGCFEGRQSCRNTNVPPDRQIPQIPQIPPDLSLGPTDRSQSSGLTHREYLGELNAFICSVSHAIGDASGSGNHGRP